MTGLAHTAEDIPISRVISRGRLRSIGCAAALVLVLLLTACDTTVPAGAAGETPARAAAESESLVPTAASDVEPLALDEAAAPTRLQIPDVGLDAPVVPMGWSVVTVAGERTTKWDVPLDAIGWHANSPGAGSAGNMLLSGRQADGEAILEPLALGGVTPGQEILVTDEDGLTFVYRVRDVSQPIPITGATDAELASAQAYVTDGQTAQLTLITGWPEFTTTHRLFAVADLVEGPN